MTNLTFQSSVGSLATSRRRWRIIGLLNTDEIRDITSDDNKIEVAIPVTLLHNKNYTVGSQHKFSIVMSASGNFTSIDVVSLQFTIKEIAASAESPATSDPTLVEVR